jgi:endonuclease YncB( thermonuclease family)
VNKLPIVIFPILVGVFSVAAQVTTIPALNPTPVASAVTPAPVPTPTHAAWPWEIYDGKIIRVVDGDTVVLDVQLGWNTWLRNQTSRLFGINAPEMSTPEGVAAKAHLEKLLKEQCGPGTDNFVFRSFQDKRDKYGRLLIDVLCVSYMDATKRAAVIKYDSVNEWMVRDGHAKHARY